MDAFEQQLKTLFDGCAECVDGRLGIDGLHNLCDRLDLQTHKADLVESLLNAKKDESFITFPEFKEALVKLLGREADLQRSGGDSPSREVSPKYVFGKKKYGRRSRPDITDCESNLVEGVEACSVDEESVIKKRKTQNDDAYLDNGGEELEKSQESEEELLIAAWAAIASPTGRITKEQLVRVFQTVGLQSGSEEAASSVFEKLEVGDEGITLEALLSFIKGGVTLSKESKTQDFLDSSTSIDFEDNLSRYITGSRLIELWESAGVHDGKQILQSLGCRPAQQYELSLLTSRFHAYLQGARDGQQSGTVMKAGLVLQRAYIHLLKGVVEQMSGENEKLKADVAEANQRAQLLAQEVDEHHSRLEAATLRRVKALEQRHADRVRELTEQVKSEQEQLAQQNQILEKKVAVLEGEELKSRTEFMRLQGENCQLQEEHQSLLDQLSSLQKERDTLQRNVQELSAAQANLRELEEGMKDKDVVALLERVAGLEGENRSLRDRNDELSLQVEDLSSRLYNASINKRSSVELSPTVDATMRDVVPLALEQSTNAKVLSDVECDDSDGYIGEKRSQGVALEGSGKTVKLNLKINGEICGLKLKVALRDKLSALISLDNAIKEAVLNELDNVVNQEELSCDCDSLQNSIDALKGEVSKVKDEDKKLKERCKELEKSLEQLQDEYEKTEDYWTSKLEEERNLFDAEQKQSDEKYSELVNKILEYEEMLKEEMAARQRLETIEEKDGLERQVAELEEEYSKLLAEKDTEIDRLQKELTCHPPVVDTPVQTEQPTYSNAPPEGSSQHSYCRRSLTFSSGDRRRYCCKVYRLQKEVQHLLETKQAAQQELSALLAERDHLYKQVLNRRREASCSVNLNSKLICAERKCRSLMSTVRNQQLQAAELLRSAWQEHRLEQEELRALIAVKDGKIQQQAVQIQHQGSKLAQADILVKELFVENADLVSSLRKLETYQFRQPQSSP